MKAKIRALALAAMALLVLSGCIIYAPYGDPDSEPGAPYGRTMDMSYFYDYLSDYGTWIYWPGYDYVWTPYHVGYGWHPFANGRWVWTEYGWTWVSYEAWGWVPYHYGRWVWARGFGWFWVPDTVWGPAWVSWRYSSSWIGWAPIPPRHRYGRHRGLVLHDIDLDVECWAFVSVRQFNSDRVGRHIIGPDRNREIIRKTDVITHISDQDGHPVNIGFGREQTERLTRTSIPIYELQNAARPEQPRISSGRVIVFRPEVVSRTEAKPRSFVTKEEAERSRAPIRKSAEPRTVDRSSPSASTTTSGQSAARETSVGPAPGSGREVIETRGVIGRESSVEDPARKERDRPEPVPSSKPAETKRVEPNKGGSTEGAGSTRSEAKTSVETKRKAESRNGRPGRKDKD